MKASLDCTEEKYYITDIPSSLGQSSRDCGKKMDPAFLPVNDTSSADHQRKPGDSLYEGNEALKIAEEVSYMADYIFDRNNKIQAVRYDPVSVKKEGRP